MTVLHAKGGPAEEKQEEGRPAQPLLHRGIWTRPSVRDKGHFPWGIELIIFQFSIHVLCPWVYQILIINN